VIEEVIMEEQLRYWSNDSMWIADGFVKPVAGTDAIIPASWKLVVDEETAKLNNLEVRGQLIIPQNVTKTIINAEQIWFNTGKLVVGTQDILDLGGEANDSDIFTSNLYINCSGVQTFNTWSLQPSVELGNNVIATTGDFSINGME